MAVDPRIDLEKSRVSQRVYAAFLMRSKLRCIEQRSLQSIRSLQVVLAMRWLVLSVVHLGAVAVLQARILNANPIS